jgi:hypothetical protein
MSYVMSSGDQSVDDYDISALTAVLQSMGLEVTICLTCCVELVQLRAFCNQPIYLSRRII